MWQHLLAVVGLALLCGGWVLVQRVVARRAPPPAGSGGCGACSCGRGTCERERRAE